MEKDLTSKQLMSVRDRAQNITETAKEQYKIEVERLKLFNARWNAFINSTVKKYPSEQTRKLVVVSQMITEILMRDEEPFYTCKDKIEDVYKIIDNGDFNMPSKIEKPSLYGKSESGFDMEEVLNPKGELDLKTLLKELGVTE